MNKKDLRPISVHTVPFAFSVTGMTIPLDVSDIQKIDIEMFAHLEYYSEIKENGIKRFIEINPDNGTEDNWRMFRSFIRQARLFYFSAKTQDSSISPLNYFYSFENLVKAYCCLYHPVDVNNKISHGLGTGTVFSDDFNQEITIKKKGIMPIFYKLITGEEITEEKKLLNKLLIPYCADISYENDLANPGLYRKSLFMKAGMGGIGPQDLSLVISVSGSLQLLKKYPQIFKVFNEHFNLVDIPQRTADEVLKIPLNEYQAYIFFQSKEDFKSTPLEWVASDFYRKFFPFVSVYPRDTKRGFKLHLPVDDTENNQITMNECISIFILMFYMSELVRYHPKTIQDNLCQPTGWLMERFTVNTPQTFLRYMVNLIVGQDMIFS